MDVQQKPVNEKDKNLVRTDSNGDSAEKLQLDPYVPGENVNVFCRVRPPLEDEVPSSLEFPDDATLCVEHPAFTFEDRVYNPKINFEFDRVYGPHVGQDNLLRDVKPFVQSAIGGCNVTIFAYGPARSGKTHTMSGLYASCFRELFELSNSVTTSTSKYDFSVSIYELHNEQIRDLLIDSVSVPPKAQMDSLDNFGKLVWEKVDNAMKFDDVLKSALGRRVTSKCRVSHLIVTVHIHSTKSGANSKSGVNSHYNMNLVDLAGSSTVEEDSGEHVTELLHVMKSLFALGNALASKKEEVPYENSTLTQVLAGSLGRNAKKLLIVNISPDASTLSETLSSLSFAARIKEQRDIVNATREELYDKKAIAELKGKLCDKEKEIAELKQALSRVIQESVDASSTVFKDPDAEENCINVQSTKRKSYKDIMVFCRVRPLLEDEGPSSIYFHNYDDYATLRVTHPPNTYLGTVYNWISNFEFDRVYGPLVGQAELFSDVKPFVKSAFEGNVAIFAYGPACSGKTHTMEGRSSNDHGLYARCFEELIVLSNSDKTSRYESTYFSVSIYELHNEKIRDLLKDSGSVSQMVSSDSFDKLVWKKVENAKKFDDVLKSALRHRDESKHRVSHLIVTIHIHYSHPLTKENKYNKLSLVDLAGSGVKVEEDSGEHATELLHVMKSLSALGDVLNSLASKKGNIPYENSTLTQLLAGSLGGTAKTLFIVNVCQSAASNLSGTLLSLGFSAIIKKRRDTTTELCNMENEITALMQEVCTLKQELKAKDLSDKEEEISCHLDSSPCGDYSGEYVLGAAMATGTSGLKRKRKPLKAEKVKKPSQKTKPSVLLMTAALLTRGKNFSSTGFMHLM